MKCPHCPVAAGTECHGETWHTGLCDLAATGQPGALDLIRHRATLPRVPEPPPRAEPPLPSLGRMAVGFVASQAVHLMTGAEDAPPEVKAARLATCETCDHFRPSDRRCGQVDGCGCWLDKKTGQASAACPLGKWGPV